MTARVAVVGASGFIGQAVTDAIEAYGVECVPIKAPRLSCEAQTLDDILRAAEKHVGVLHALTDSLNPVSHLVNCAGIAVARGEGQALFGANSLLPALLAQAAEDAGISRFVHVSSASVQGHSRVLSAQPDYAPFSPYSQSKVWGEQVLTAHDRVIVYRPTSVHGTGRPVTRSLARFARSSFASVAGSGASPTPQVLVENVADAVRHLLLVDGDVPAITLHPSEGLTTGSVLTLLGGKRPRRVPERLAKTIVRTAAVGPPHPRVLALQRRLEMLWFGQGQEESWLSADGWIPVAGEQAWRKLGTDLRALA